MEMTREKLLDALQEHNSEFAARFSQYDENLKEAIIAVALAVSKTFDTPLKLDCLQAYLEMEQEKSVIA